MSDFVIVGTLVLLVLLVLVGQWLMNRRAGLARGDVAPELRDRCPEGGLVFFHAPGCSACRRMYPVIQRWAEADPVRVCLVDISREPSLASASRLVGTPTLMRIEGGRVVEVALGDVGQVRVDRMAGAAGLCEPSAGH